MPSTIPLFGLKHKIDIVRQTEGDDGAGGIGFTGLTVIYEKKRARICPLDNDDEQKGFGNASGDHVKIVAVYLPNTQKSDFLRVSASSIVTPIPKNKLYRIVRVIHRDDDRGRFHHTSLMVELEDIDTPIV